MALDVVKRCLLGQRALLLEHGVSALYVFGSVAHGRATAHSDIDLLVEFSRPIGLIAFVRLQQRLTEALGHPVDLVTPAALAVSGSRRAVAGLDGGRERPAVAARR